MRIGTWPLVALALVGAAALEVAGAAIVRVGLRGGGGARVALGSLLLAGYGIAVNLVPWDFGRLLGAYVAVFALVAVLAGRFVFGEPIATTTWLGLALIALGASLIQLGS